MAGQFVHPILGPAQSKKGQYIRDFLGALPQAGVDTLSSGAQSLGSGVQAIPGRVEGGIYSLLSGEDQAPAAPAAPMVQKTAPSYADPNPALLAALKDDPTRERTIDELRSGANLKEYVNPVPGGDQQAIERMRANTNLIEQKRGVLHTGGPGGDWYDAGKTPTSSQSRWEDAADARQVAQGEQQQGRAMANVAMERDAQLFALERAEKVAKAEQNLLERQAAVAFVIANKMPQNDETIKMVMALNRSENTKKALNMLSAAMKAGVIDKEEYDRQFNAFNAINATAQSGVTYANKPETQGMNFTSQ